MLRKGTRAATHALTRAGSSSFDTLVSFTHRLPIQRAVDVAVPLEVAWVQWIELCHLPEGSHRVTEVERRGDHLWGRLDGATSREWEADVVDERKDESFAWRSTEGSDSAGLVTFHKLSDRLTRIELDLDVRPVDPLEAVALALRVADRRAESALRRFKADAELLNPDGYEELLASQNGEGGSR